MMQMVLRQTQGSQGRAGYFLATAAVSLLRVTGLMERDKAYFCNQTAHELAALELPYPARFAACQQIAASTNGPPPMFVFSRMLLPGLGSFHIRVADQTALARVAATSLAIERFRLAHTNALPQSLEQLVPTCCKAVPADPYDGQPLRYKMHGASYVVYSVGSDGQDDGGAAWDSPHLRVPQDIAFVVKH
jgi:hypothetical protein